MSVSSGWKLQRNIDRIQAIPVIGAGPALGNVLLSSTELIAGIGMVVLFGSAVVLIRTERLQEFLAKNAVRGIGHMGVGSFGITYGLANVASLGFVGFVIESEIKKLKRLTVNSTFRNAYGGNLSGHKLIWIQT